MHRPCADPCRSWKFKHPGVIKLICRLWKFHSLTTLTPLVSWDMNAINYTQEPARIPRVTTDSNQVPRCHSTGLPPTPPGGTLNGRDLSSPLLGQRVENEEWFTKNAQLKQAGADHWQLVTICHGISHGNGWDNPWKWMG